MYWNRPPPQQQGLYLLIHLLLVLFGVFLCQSLFSIASRRHRRWLYTEQHHYYDRSTVSNHIYIMIRLPFFVCFVNFFFLMYQEDKLIRKHIGRSIMMMIYIEDILWLVTFSCNTNFKFIKCLKLTKTGLHPKINDFLPIV